MKEENLVEFDPTTSELQAIVAVTSKIKADDLSDVRQIAVVKENRIALRDARVKIEKTGKGLREEALKFQKAVIAKEKELIAIIEPEEERLKAIEDEAKEIALRKERLDLLPERTKRLQGIMHIDSFPNDDELLGMDSIQFETLINSLNAQSIEKQKQIAEQEAESEIAKIKAEQDAREAEMKAQQGARELELKREADARQVEIDAQNAKIKAEQDVKQAEIEAKQKEIAIAEQKIADEKARKEAEDKAKLEAEIKAKRDAEALAQAEMEKMAEIEKKAKYLAFLKTVGYSEASKLDFHFTKAGDEIIAYKKVGVFNSKTNEQI